MSEPVKVIEFPKEVNVQNASDYVTYTAYESGSPRRCVKSACYAAHMDQLTQLSFKLEPTEGYTACPNETFMKWILLCKQSGLIPEPVLEYVENGKNYLWIPAKIYDRHTVYMTMCCYRWSASNPKMIWQFVEHAKKNPGITFWQILHFALATWSGGAGHSFSNISRGVYGGYNLLLSHSLAIKHFCSQPLHQRPKTKSYTYEQMTEIAGSLDPHSKCKLKTMDEILQEKWTPLYQVESLNKKIVDEIYEKINKN